MGFFNVYDDYVFCDPRCTPEEDRVLSPRLKNTQKFIDLYSDQARKILEEAKKSNARPPPAETNIIPRVEQRKSKGGNRKSAVTKGKNRVIGSEEDDPIPAEQIEEELETDILEQHTSDEKTDSQIDPVLHSTITLPEEYDMTFVLNIALAAVETANQNIPEQRQEIEPINSAEQNNKVSSK